MIDSQFPLNTLEAPLQSCHVAKDA